MLRLGGVPARAAGSEDALSRALLRDFKKEIVKHPSGREVYSRLARSGPEGGRLRAVVRYEAGEGIASFDPEENAVVLNSAAMSGFFGIKKEDPGSAPALLSEDPAARAALAGRADSTFVHELVHALQYYLYPNYRRDVPKGVPLEFEYEAYMTESMYTHEKMARDPARLRVFLRGGGRDVYTVAAMNSYLALSLDPESYKEKIRGLYEDELGGFISFERAEKVQKNSVEESKIFAYAAGRTGEYAHGQASLREVRSEKEAYDKYLRDFYANRWPSFSANALFFLGSVALEEKIYPLALECLAVADVHSKSRGVPEKEMPRLREKGALAVLEAAAYIKDHAADMKLEDLAAHVRALETACANTGRPFPPDLEAVRGEVYPKAGKFYSEKAASEKNKGKARVYAENAAYFRRAPGARRD
jgi:hypothetical protein